jgi:hypothetical protein
MKVGGKITEWRVNPAEFTVSIPCGELRIIAEGCDRTLTDMLFEAMKDRTTVYLEAGA